LDSECRFWCIRRGTLPHLVRQLLRAALIRVHVEDPWVAEFDVCDRPVLVAGPVVERTLHHASPMLLRDLHGFIRAERIENHNVIRPLQRAQAVLEIDFLVERQHQH